MLTAWAPHFAELVFATGALEITTRIAYVYASNVGSVVECSPATRAARVRFPDVAAEFCFVQMGKSFAIVR